ncbi:PREDICTED: uncharacterized protein LOC109373331 [Hipposideros armiger]|uniref:Uncharacterized protein LOC109373331 n=1 Tax=Hipposideros armiger TaxID=186990 RepID=A0A8B7Q2I1_HIPAR|nr:PREDICTED: uncharacterized protein LOC109373331 [Hipposideros armiger]XP_019482647.1 PREDICTED: uncharacterized protein LOC109373331 [Hipposideros armiger]
MTQYRPVHRSQNLAQDPTQNPTSQEHLVDFQIPTSLMGIQREVAAAAEQEVEAAVEQEEIRGTMEKDRLSPRAWSPASWRLSSWPWLGPSPALSPTRRRSCASKRTPTKVTSTWKAIGTPTWSRPCNGLFWRNRGAWQQKQPNIHSRITRLTCSASKKQTPAQAEPAPLGAAPPAPPGPVAPGTASVLPCLRARWIPRFHPEMCFAC